MHYERFDINVVEERLYPVEDKGPRIPLVGVVSPDGETVTVDLMPGVQAGLVRQALGIAMESEA